MADRKQEEEKKETLKSKLPPAHVAGQVVSTLTVTAVLSFLGTTGTLAGLVLGSALSAVMPTAWEHWISRGSSRARARYKELRLTRMEPEAAWAQARREEHERVWRAVHWKVLGASFGVVLAATSGAIAIAEAAAGKPVSDIVQGRRGSGSTFTGGGGYTPPPASPSALPSGSSPSPGSTSSSPPSSSSPLSSSPPATPSSSAFPSSSPPVTTISPATSSPASPPASSGAPSPQASGPLP